MLYIYIYIYIYIYMSMQHKQFPWNDHPRALFNHPSCNVAIAATIAIVAPAPLN